MGCYKLTYTFKKTSRGKLIYDSFATLGATTKPKFWIDGCLSYAHNGNQVQQVNDAIINGGVKDFPDQPQFVNPNQANQQIQRASNAWDATQSHSIIITINSNTRIGLDGPINPVLWQRGRMIRNQLIQMGVPEEAFPDNWLQFNRVPVNQRPNVNIRVGF